MAETTAPAPAASGVRIDPQTFKHRLSNIYKHWQDRRAEWGDADVLVVAAGESDEDKPFQKTFTAQLYITGYEIPKCIMVFTKDTLYVLSSAKKTKYISEAVAAVEDLGTKVELLTENKADGDKENFEKLMTAVKAEGLEGTVEGKGDFVKRWKDAVTAAEGVEEVDMTAGFAELTAVKEEADLKTVKEAALLSVATLKHSFINRFEEVVDEEKKVSHEKLAEDVENDMADMKKLRLHKENAPVKNVNMDVLEPCYPPIIQSGGEYDLKPSAYSNEKNLHYGVVTVSLGARYKSYCSNVARTYFIDPDKEIEANYAIALAAHQVALDNLKPGKEMQEVYKAVEAFVAKKKPGLEKHLTKNVGFGTGLEFRESSQLLNGKNTKVIKEGMVFNISLGLGNLTRHSKANDSKKKTYAIQLADTVVVQARGDAEVLTDTGDKKTSASKKYSDVSYFLEDEEEGKPAAPDKKKQKQSVIMDARDRSTKKKTEIATADRDAQQEELAKKLRSDQEARLRAQAKNKSANVTKGEDIIAYSRPNDYPEAVSRKNCIQVDTRNEVIFVPVNGMPVPFHVSLVKNVSKSGGEDGSWTFLRIIFNTPTNVGLNKDMSVSQQISRHSTQTFISEVSFKSKNKANIDTNVRLINELRKRIRTRELDRAHRAAVPEQEALVVNRRGPIPRLSDLKMRPLASGRKSTGILEAHENGFRFTTQRGEKIDILYTNVKHALHQPAENELIVLIHFHLKYPILVGKKKQVDIQFYSEIGELAGESLDQRRGSAWDPDEIEEEQREREYRQRLNKEYEDFIKRVEAKAVSFELEFDIPYAELSFDGVPFRECVTISPSVHTLNALISTPFFVLTLEDVEIAHFERIETGTALRTFDMVFVFKDYSKAVHRISSIPGEKFEQIKNWLTSIEIKYYEGPATLSWPKILKHIEANLEDFIQDGGWEAVLGLDSDAEGEEEESDDPDSDFGPDEGGSSEEEEEDDEEMSEEEEEEEDSDASDEDDEEEEGMSWDELEKEAERSDRRREREDDDASFGANKKHKSSHKGPPSKKMGKGPRR